MDNHSIPKELLETLQELEINGPESDVSPAMIQVLEDQGFVETLDGVPTVTRTGLAVLKEYEKEQPHFL